MILNDDLGLFLPPEDPPSMRTMTPLGAAWLIRGAKEIADQTKPTNIRVERGLPLVARVEKGERGFDFVISEELASELRFNAVKKVDDGFVFATMWLNTVAWGKICNENLPHLPI